MITLTLSLHRVRSPALLLLMADIDHPDLSTVWPIPIDCTLDPVAHNAALRAAGAYVEGIRAMAVRSPVPEAVDFKDYTGGPVAEGPELVTVYRQTPEGKLAETFRRRKGETEKDVRDRATALWGVPIHEIAFRPAQR